MSWTQFKTNHVHLKVGTGKGNLQNAVIFFPRNKSHANCQKEQKSIAMGKKSWESIRNRPTMTNCQPQKKVSFSHFFSLKSVDTCVSNEEASDLRSPNLSINPRGFYWFCMHWIFFLKAFFRVELVFYLDIFCYPFIMQFCFDFIYIVWLLNEDQLWSSCRPECRFLKVGTFSKDLIFQIFKWKLKPNVALLFYMIYLGYHLKSIRPNRLVLCLLLIISGKVFFSWGSLKSDRILLQVSYLWRTLQCRPLKSLTDPKNGCIFHITLHFGNNYVCS